MSLKINLMPHVIILFLLEAPHFYKNTDRWLIIKSSLITSNLIPRRGGIMIRPPEIEVSTEPLCIQKFG